MGKISIVSKLFYMPNSRIIIIQFILLDCHIQNFIEKNDYKKESKKENNVRRTFREERPPYRPKVTELE